MDKHAETGIFPPFKALFNGLGGIAAGISGKCDPQNDHQTKCSYGFHISSN
jgi:hypothetical protein